MPSEDRITANLPSRDFGATADFYARLGFAVRFRNENWMMMQRGALEVEFFPHPELDPGTSWFSACVRVDDLDGLRGVWQGAGLPADDRSIPRMTDVFKMPYAPRMFALVDPDGSLLRILDNGDRDVR